jgi:hypothetical protein
MDQDQLKARLESIEQLMSKLLLRHGVPKEDAAEWLRTVGDEASPPLEILRATSFLEDAVSKPE